MGEIILLSIIMPTPVIVLSSIFLYLVLGCITLIPLDSMVNLHNRVNNFALATIFCWPIIWIILLIMVICLFFKYILILCKSTFKLCKVLLSLERDDDDDDDY